MLVLFNMIVIVCVAVTFPWSLLLFVLSTFALFVLLLGNSPTADPFSFVLIFPDFFTRKPETMHSFVATSVNKLKFLSFVFSAFVGGIHDFVMGIGQIGQLYSGGNVDCWAYCGHAHFFQPWWTREFAGLATTSSSPKTWTLVLSRHVFPNQKYLAGNHWRGGDDHKLDQKKIPSDQQKKSKHTHHHHHRSTSTTPQREDNHIPSHSIKWFLIHSPFHNRNHNNTNRVTIQE